MKEEKDHTELKGYFHFNEVLRYFFRKKDPDRKTNFNLKMMHGINKLSMLIFVLALLYLAYKYIFL